MKPRIAFVTPLPPHSSGVADYSAELLPELSALSEVDVFYVGAEPQRLPAVRVVGPLSTLDALVEGYDVIFLQVSNEPDSFEMIRFARRHPSVVVMHDLNLSGIYGSAYLRKGRIHLFLGEILRQEGPYAFWKVFWRFAVRRKSPDPHDYRMSSGIAVCAKAVVVHSRATASALNMKRGKSPVVVLPHGTPPVDPLSESDIQAAREELKIPGDAFVVGAFGALSERKRIRSLLEAVRSLTGHPRLLCCLVGPASDSWRALVEEMGLEHCVRITDRVPMDTFYRYIGICDICVNLRFPWMGEESGPVLRIMASGKPVIVSDIGSFSEMPSEACIHIRTDEHEIDDLTAALTEGLNDGTRLKRIGANARDYCIREHSWSAAANAYLRVAEDIRAR